VQGRPDAAQGGRFLVRNAATWKKIFTQLRSQNTEVSPGDSKLKIFLVDIALG
jgi:hypothetical protein